MSASPVLLLALVEVPEPVPAGVIDDEVTGGVSALGDEGGVVVLADGVVDRLLYLDLEPDLRPPALSEGLEALQGGGTARRLRSLGPPPAAGG